MSWHSVFNLLIFIPPLAFDYNCPEIGLFLTAIGILKNTEIFGDTEVSRKIFSIILMLIILVYISAGMFMVIENFDKTQYPNPLYFH